jgi:glycopeptide antibiotics resistance protein
METRATGRSKRQKSYEFYKKLYKLTIGGGLAFWATTIAISLTPIRAEFRAALSMSYIQTVLVEALLGGIIISCFVSFFLLRFFEKIPTKNQILKSVILSFVPYVISLILLGVAASRTSDALHIFLIGAALNVPTFLILGIVIGYLYKRLYRSLHLRPADGLK